MMNIKYNVVVGCPRSGTTYLMSALNALPKCECISGLIFPVAIPHLVNSSLPVEIYESLSWALEDSLHVYLDSGFPNSKALAVQKWLNGCMEIPELIQLFQNKRVIESIVYKENFLSFAPEFTYNSLPNCRLLYIYRDGRDCANSLVQSYDVLTDEKLRSLRTSEMPFGRKYNEMYIPWWVGNGMEEEFLASSPYVRAIWMWKEMVRCCHSFFTRPEIVASGRVMFLKYEELVNDPLKYGTMVVEHFGSTMNDQLKKRFKRARIRSIGLHRKRDVTEIKEAERIAKDELELYGYL